MKKVYYKIFRKRQQQSWWTDITFHYSSSHRLDEDEALLFARDYKKQHRTDGVKIVKYTEEETEIPYDKN